MARKNPRKRIYVGTDGITYKGKAVKARKRLEYRIAHFERVVDKARYKSGYKRPGEMKCR